MSPWSALRMIHVLARRPESRSVATAAPTIASNSSSSAKYTRRVRAIRVALSKDSRAHPCFIEACKSQGWRVDRGGTAGRGRSAAALYQNASVWYGGCRMLVPAKAKAGCGSVATKDAALPITFQSLAYWLPPAPPLPPGAIDALTQSVPS